MFIVHAFYLRNYTLTIIYANKYLLQKHPDQKRVSVHICLKRKSNPSPSTSQADVNPPHHRDSQL